MANCEYCEKKIKNFRTLRVRIDAYKENCKTDESINYYKTLHVCNDCCKEVFKIVRKKLHSAFGKLNPRLQRNIKSVQDKRRKETEELKEITNRFAKETGRSLK